MRKLMIGAVPAVCLIFIVLLGLQLLAKPTGRNPAAFHRIHTGMEWGYVVDILGKPDEIVEVESNTHGRIAQAFWMDANKNMQMLVAVKQGETNKTKGKLIVIGGAAFGKEMRE